jgi:hypothetical protein
MVVRWNCGDVASSSGEAVNGVVCFEAIALCNDQTDDNSFLVPSITMNQQQTTNMGGYGNSGAYNPPPRQDLEYICAGQSLREYLRATLMVCRLRREKRNQISRAHSVQRMWTSHHVQEADDAQ